MHRLPRCQSGPRRCQARAPSLAALRAEKLLGGVERGVDSRRVLAAGLCHVRPAAALAAKAENAAAAALAEELAARGHESKTYNTLDFLPKGAADLISRGHDFAYRYTPKLYGAGYRREEKRPSPLLYENSIRGIGPLYEALMDLGADAAICVHVFPAMMMTELRCSYGLRMPAWFVATDFTCSPGVGELQLDGICIPHPALTPEFEANIRAEFIDNIKRLRHHASLGLWCGNNEMEEFVYAKNSWLTKPQEVRDYYLMYERIIPEIVKEYDPQTFYWPSSPSSGGCLDEPQDPERGDVHYWDVWHGNKPFTEYRKFYFRFLSEFGFQSFPSIKTIETFTDDPDDMNIFSYVMERHQRNGSANGKIMNYMQQTYRYPSDFRTVLYASQLLQADGIRYGVEHFRRNRGRCMGAVYWQLNDCWPVASWSSIDYCGRLKALHYYAKRFFAPLMLSCEERGMMSNAQPLNWQHSGEFEKSIRLNVANETREDAKVIVHWALRKASAEVLQSGEETVAVPALTSVWLEKIEFPKADPYSEYISYELEKDGEIISAGSVNFSYPKYFRYEDPQLTCRVIGDEIEVTASAYAKSVEILNENEDLILSDNYFDMNAGTKRVKIEHGDAGKLRLRSVYDIR